MQTRNCDRLGRSQWVSVGVTDSENERKTKIFEGILLHEMGDLGPTVEHDWCVREISLCYWIDQEHFALWDHRVECLLETGRHDPRCLDVFFRLQPSLSIECHDAFDRALEDDDLFLSLGKG